MAHIGKLVVCGVGLIGGSFALALRRAGAVERIVGIGRRREVLERACALGVIDEIAEGWADALDGADLVLLAAPVGQTDAILAAMAPHLRPGTIVTDAGSTKRDVVAALRTHLGGALADVVPAHPIAGAEKSGVEAAFAELYMGRKVVLTPLPESRPEAVQKVRDAWEACGANVVGMTPQEHDRVFAAVSHLPHLLAFGLVDDLAGRSNAPLLFSHAASGFRDFTRIAGSHPEMWRDICVANRVALLEELDAYLGELARLRMMLVEGDGDGLEAVFERARRARNAWAEGLPIRTAE
ncbi:MAG TPA: prephenate dehydrogenase/arogenate dehydrogenase family protein [Thauera aminoaromatica]|jgi:prephenate dehydrogenase|uniref:Prephenate dehydrogenase/arogenate dehydrogenase family protein n=1 Tax=Thauera aminoaromatica TaxID=164330 RepID=A0A5C7SP50_THASP|nr:MULTISPECIES: prephenate dehydrogenase/arogenate dehydrogenase family protein [Thauera]MDA0235188.1 prephenate dehydrogenase/arogenate dehydrogenase family protein [Pseudomonadota bacterium]OPZ05641.1 MAG: T-protein [Alphaproteobacteria bacterium ADurb.BinA305]KIN88579.1 prephenate dehydrogenase family protein [Thauera sp. SWB20]MBL8461425.1 prephenate dehydrogenase/arogenate dehydrogenase family protein [Thauera sp.]MBP6133195.1 prephenate dehydrogenase/arogenate dehydrogenase family prote